MNLSQANKQILETYCEAGGKVYEVAYDPTIVGTMGGSSDPEGDAVAAGLIEWFREDTTYLVEVIYTSSICPPHV